MGDALAHSIVPGVAGAYMLRLPYAAGAFFAGVLASLGMAMVKSRTRLREDAIIGLVFTSFFALGLLMVSINPTAVNVQSIVLGNILGISDDDAFQVVLISAISLAVLVLKWKDLMVVFFDENHASPKAGVPKGARWRSSRSCTAVRSQTGGAWAAISSAATSAAMVPPLTYCRDASLTITVSTVATTSRGGAQASKFVNCSTGGAEVGS